MKRARESLRSCLDSIAKEITQLVQQTRAESNEYPFKLSSVITPVTKTLVELAKIIWRSGFEVDAEIDGVCTGKAKNITQLQALQLFRTVIAQVGGEVFDDAIINNIIVDNIAPAALCAARASILISKSEGGCSDGGDCEVLEAFIKLQKSMIKHNAQFAILFYRIIIEKTETAIYNSTKNAKNCVQSENLVFFKACPPSVIGFALVRHGALMPQVTIKSLLNLTFLAAAGKTIGCVDVTEIWYHFISSKVPLKAAEFGDLLTCCSQQNAQGKVISYGDGTYLLFLRVLFARILADLSEKQLKNYCEHIVEIVSLDSTFSTAFFLLYDFISVVKSRNDAKFTSLLGDLESVAVSVIAGSDELAGAIPISFEGPLANGVLLVASCLSDMRAVELAKKLSNVPHETSEGWDAAVHKAVVHIALIVRMHRFSRRWSEPVWERLARCLEGQCFSSHLEQPIVDKTKVLKQIAILLLEVKDISASCVEKIYKASFKSVLLAPAVARYSALSTEEWIPCTASELKSCANFVNKSNIVSEDEKLFFVNLYCDMMTSAPPSQRFSLAVSFVSVLKAEKNLCRDVAVMTRIFDLLSQPFSFAQKNVDVSEIFINATQPIDIQNDLHVCESAICWGVAAGLICAACGSLIEASCLLKSGFDALSAGAHGNLSGACMYALALCIESGNSEVLAVLSSAPPLPEEAVHYFFVALSHRFCYISLNNMDLLFKSVSLLVNGCGGVLWSSSTRESLLHFLVVLAPLTSISDPVSQCSSLVLLGNNLPQSLVLQHKILFYPLPAEAVSEIAADAYKLTFTNLELNNFDHSEVCAAVLPAVVASLTAGSEGLCISKIRAEKLSLALGLVADKAPVLQSSQVTSVCVSLLLSHFYSFEGHLAILRMCDSGSCYWREVLVDDKGHQMTASDAIFKLMDLLMKPVVMSPCSNSGDVEDNLISRVSSCTHLAALQRLLSTFADRVEVVLAKVLPFCVQCAHSDPVYHSHVLGILETCTKAVKIAQTDQSETTTEARTAQLSLAVAAVECIKEIVCPSLSERARALFDSLVFNSNCLLPAASRRRSGRGSSPVKSPKEEPLSASFRSLVILVAISDYPFLKNSVESLTLELAVKESALGLVEALPLLGTSGRILLLSAFVAALNKCENPQQVLLEVAQERKGKMLFAVVNSTCRRDKELMRHALELFGIAGAALVRKSIAGFSTLCRSDEQGNKNGGAQQLEFCINASVNWSALSHYLLCSIIAEAYRSRDAPHDSVAFAAQTAIEASFRAQGFDGTAPVSSSQLNEFSWWSQLPTTLQNRYASYITTKYSRVGAIVRVEVLKAVYVKDISWGKWARRVAKTVVGYIDQPFCALFDAFRSIALVNGDTVLRRLITHLFLHLLTRAHCMPEVSKFVLGEALGIAADGGVDFALQLFDLCDCALLLSDAIHTSQEGLSSVSYSSLAPIVDSFRQPFITEETQESIITNLRDLYLNAALRHQLYERVLRCIELPRQLSSLSDNSGLGARAAECFSALGDSASARTASSAFVEVSEGFAVSNQQDGPFFAMLTSDVKARDNSNATRAKYAAAARRGGCVWSALQIATAKLDGDTANDNNLEHEAQEAAWRLSCWDKVSDYFVGDSTDCLVAQPLKSLCIGTDVKKMLNFAQNQVTERILATPHEGDCRVSDKDLFLIQALQDIKSVSSVSNVEEAFRLIDCRLKPPFLSYSGEDDGDDNCGIIFSVYKSLLEHCRWRGDVDNRVIGQLHVSVLLEEAKALARAGNYDAALSRLCGNCNDKNASLEPRVIPFAAEILYMRGDSIRAVKFAERAASSNEVENRALRAGLLVDAAVWADELSFYSAADIAALLRNALELDPASARAHLTLGICHAKSFKRSLSVSEATSSPTIVDSGSAAQKAREQTAATLVAGAGMDVVEGMESLAKALELSPEKVTSALPRYLTLWLDGAATVDSMNRTSAAMREKVAAASGRIARTATRTLGLIPTRLFLIGLSQLLSRLGAHPSGHVVTEICELCKRLLEVAPQQVLWQLYPLFLSRSNSARAATVKQSILQVYAKSSRPAGVLANGMLKFFSALIEVCNAPASTTVVTALPKFSELLPRLPSLALILPTVTATYPVVGLPDVPGGVGFTDTERFIAGVVPECEVMHSLQKPKRIQLIDSSGARHSYLMKARDEPRKDMRMMEVAMVMNSIFAGSTDARTRECCLRRYAVFALNDESAMIEWVPRTRTFRSIMEKTYATDCSGISIKRVKQLLEECERQKKKDELLTKYILPQCPPVFHQWFTQQFVSPSLWYGARQRYMRCCALWSMVGHIVGLGDRHCENLLLCLDTGDLVHVDFALLFDSGERLAIPEVVRFRLTQNIVDGLGVVGVEGAFTHLCCRSLSALADNKDIIMNVLETFVHDPLTEWTKKSEKDRKLMIDRCSRRLHGFIDLYGEPPDGTPLSISGQVSKLIRHCSSIKALSVMYVWWMPWL